MKNYKITFIVSEDDCENIVIPTLNWTFSGWDNFKIIAVERRDVVKGGKRYRN